MQRLLKKRVESHTAVGIQRGKVFMSDADPDGETNHHNMIYSTYRGMVCLS